MSDGMPLPLRDSHGSRMSPATKLFLLALIRLAKGLISETEKWMQASEHQ